MIEWKCNLEYDYCLAISEHMLLTLTKDPIGENWYRLEWRSDVCRTKYFIAQDWDEAKIIAVNKVRTFLKDIVPYWEQITHEFEEWTKIDDEGLSLQND